jgi:tol-pal system protein YbgF
MPVSIPLLSARAWVAGLCLALASAVASAALFDDNEARKAIIELRQQVEGVRLSLETMNQRVETLRQAVEAQQQRMVAVYQAIEELRIRAESDRADFKQGSGRATDEVTKLRGDLREDVTIVKGGIIELKNQIEELRSEAARMRGVNEQLKRELSDGQIRQKDMAEGQIRQKDLAQDLDKRFLAATQRLEQRLLDATKIQDEKFEKSQSTMKGLDDRLLAATKGQDEKFEKLNSTVKGLDDRLLAVPKGQDDTLRTTIQGLDAKVQGLDARLSATAQGMEERFRTVEPVKVKLDGLEFMAEQAEKRDFEAALALFRKAEFAGAKTAFFDFLSRYSRSGYAPSALFWLGTAQYATRDYAGAMVNFRALIASAADHQRTPEAVLSVANCQVELKDIRGARKTLQDLVSAYPKSEAAVAARERLALLK